MIKRMLTVLLLPVLSVFAFGQPIDVTPPGLERDASGRLRWKKTIEAVCPSCAGKKTHDCPKCAGADDACRYCRGRPLECQPCRGTGLHKDPFVTVCCAHCHGSGTTACLGCRGRRRVRSSDGASSPCVACDGKKFFVCPVCAGEKWVAAVRPEDGDLRDHTVARLTQRRTKLRALIKAASGPERGEASIGARLRSLVERASTVIPISVNYQALLEPIVNAAKRMETPDTNGRSLFTWVALHEFESAIEDHLTHQADLVRRCLWLHRRASATDAQVAPRVRAQSLQWEMWFGGSKEDPNTCYTLLGVGFFRAPHAKTIGKDIAAWLRRHPNATVVPVSRITDRQGETIYVWVVDGKEHLNVHLVERGAIPAGVMRPFYPEVEVPLDDLGAFIQRVMAAEASAKAAGRGMWGSPERREATDLQRAHAHKKRGDFDSAVVLFRRVVDRRWSHKIWLEIAECEEKRGNIDAALAAYEKAVGDGSWLRAYEKKAQCIARHHGLERATSWLRTLVNENPRKKEYWSLLGDFLSSVERFAEAIPAYEKAIALVMDKHGFRFDKHGNLTSNPTAKPPEAYTALWPTLSELADCCYQAKQLDAALRYATMAIAAGQQIHRDETYLSKEQREVGEAQSRLTRARIYGLRGDWDAAARDLRFAGIETSGYWKKTVEELEAWLTARKTASTRPKRAK